MMKTIERNFKYSITHWFQPIYCLEDNTIIGYEALLRDASPLNASPVDMFKEARKNDFLNDLDFLSIKEAFKTFGNGSKFLFLNIFPSTLLKKNFLIWWDIYMPLQKSVVLELLESEFVKNWDPLKSIVKELQARGVKIAIDDMGEGYSFFKQWIELEPDFIKLDRYFAENLSGNPRKQKIVKSLVDLLSASTKIIIEGVEKREDLEIAKSLGISYAQGYLLGRPSPIEDFL